jgi:hypothetical protein
MVGLLVDVANGRMTVPGRLLSLRFADFRRASARGGISHLTKCLQGGGAVKTASIEPIPVVDMKGAPAGSARGLWAGWAGGFQRRKSEPSFYIGRLFDPMQSNSTLHCLLPERKPLAPRPILGLPRTKRGHLHDPRCRANARLQHEALQRSSWGGWLSGRHTSARFVYRIEGCTILALLRQSAPAFG